MKLHLDLIPQIMMTISMIGFLVVSIHHLMAVKKLRQLEKTVSSIRKDINLFRSADLQLGKSLAELIELVKKLESRQDKLEMNLLNQSSYHQGLKILEMGGEMNDIVETCHLSKAEAELLCNLHDYKSAQSLEH